MSKIVIGKSGKENVSIDLDVLLSTRALLTADSGGGKTFALKKIIEEAFGKIQILILDPEGEFSPLREHLDFVLVGKGGETPADVRSAGLVAQTLLKLRASAICDLYEMKPSERHIWVKNFIDALIEAPKEMRHPCLVIVDEAHLFCPEHGKGESEASESMIGLCTRGRKRLLCALFATQRLATLSKDASSMLLNRMIGPTFEDVNRKRAADVLGITKEDQKGFYKQIQTLEPGNFFCLGRAISRERILAHVGPIKTAHGQDALKYEMKPPPATAKIRDLLPKLADLPKAAEEQAKTVAEFKSEIRILKAQLRAQPTTPKTALVSDPRAISAAVRTARTEWEKESAQLRRSLVKVNGALQTIAATATANVAMVAPTAHPAVEIHRTGIMRVPLTKHTELPTPRGESNEGGKLRSGAERMLAALAQWSPGGMAEGQMRSHAGLKKSGTFSAYMSDLRRGGYIEERGGEVYASETGLDYCKHVPAAPSTTEEVLAIWNPKLRDGARRMLDVLVRYHGDTIGKDALGEQAELRKSGTFSAYLSDLKTARLVVVNRDGMVAANRETLFL